MGYRVGPVVPRHGRLRRTGPAPRLRRQGPRRSLRQTPGQWPLAERWFSAAVCSIDTESLRSIDGFDTGYFLYFEDVDLARRLGRRYPP